MSEELEPRIRAALRAEVANLPLTVTPSMVEERLGRPSPLAWGPPAVLATIAGVLALAIGLAWWSERGASPSGMEAMIVRSNEPIGLIQGQTRICVVARRYPSNELRAWWYAPGDGGCATTISSLTVIDDAVAPSGDDADAYSLRFLVQVTTGELDFVEIATTVHFPDGEPPYFATTDGPVGTTALDEVHVPSVVGRLETPLATPVAAPTASPAPPGPVSDCPVTQPQTTPSEIGQQLFGWTSAYGNEDLWVGGLGQDGVMAFDEGAVHRDGSIGTKLGWWRNVSGSVEISGRRLDAPAPRLHGEGSDGYGNIGFQASGVSFPTEGCWEVTGRVGDAELTFVTYVISAEAEADRLFARTETCSTKLADRIIGVTFPETWSANEPTEDQPGCIWFGPTPFEAEESPSAQPPGVAITLGSVGGPEGPPSTSVEELSRDELIVSGKPAARIELAEPLGGAGQEGVVRLTYWVSLGVSSDAGPMIVATTSTDDAGKYVINKAVLDRMIEEIVVQDD